MKNLRSVNQSWWVKVNDKFTKGLPDILGCWEGQFYAIELKREGYEPTPLQEHVLKKINLAGGTVQWFDNYESFKTWFQKTFQS